MHSQLHCCMGQQDMFRYVLNYLSKILVIMSEGENDHSANYATISHYYM